MYALVHLQHFNSDWNLYLFLGFFVFYSSRQSCRVILGFAREVPICNVSAAVISVFQSDERIHFNGLVMRAGVYTVY